MFGSGKGCTVGEMRGKGKLWIDEGKKSFARNSLVKVKIIRARNLMLSRIMCKR
jgi:hypothetical protein